LTQVAFAGLTYLSLFLAAKLSANIPFLTSIPHDAITLENATDRSKEAAAPPLYGLVVVLIPFCTAIYVASTRFTDNKHAGFDIIFASLEGMICAWLAFRWYHLPIRRGARWAWGPRRENAAFGIGVGAEHYGSKRNFGNKHDSHRSKNVELEDVATIRTTAGSYGSQRAMV
jgi:membrane-associated phospholipid phosphatase